jgi:hypothetical protein
MSTWIIFRTCADSISIPLQVRGVVVLQSPLTSTPRLASSALSSLNARSCRELAEALLLTRCCAGKGRTSDNGASTGLRTIRLARCLGSFPPNKRAMLKSDWLPQTWHLSCGLSLITSHCAQSTAFSNATALRTRLGGETHSTADPFITEPPRSDFSCMFLLPRPLLLPLFRSFQLRLPVELRLPVYHHSDITSVL